MNSTIRIGDAARYIGEESSKLQGTHITVRGVIIAFVVLFVTVKALAYRRGLKAVNYLPGFRVPFHPMSATGVVIPTNWWNPGLSFTWNWRYTTYAGHDTISCVPFLTGPPTLYTSNIDVVRQVASSSGGRSFIKNEESSHIFTRWGMNIFAAEGDTWRKHRRVMGPAFNNKLYESVWAETLATYREMISEEGWDTKDRNTAPSTQDLAMKFAMLIIGKCVFGFSFSWADPARTGGRMPVQEAVGVTADTFTISLFVPSWIKALPFKIFKRTKEAHYELGEFMRSQAARRKEEISSRTPSEQGTMRDAFSMLVQASENEEGRYKMDDSELIGNMYIMLFAGHETTARALTATIGLLASHPDLQEEVYEQIRTVVGLQRDPVYADYPKLNKVLAAFIEAARMFPPAYLMIREAYEDTTLQIPNPLGEKGSKTVPIPKGTQVIVDIIGAQYNPRYFDAPGEYRPSRWHSVSAESEAFTGFSIGPRACIGRKFASTEAVCFLTMLLRDFKLEPVLKANETNVQWRERVFSPHLGLALRIQDFPVAFVRRQN